MSDLWDVVGFVLDLLDVCDLLDLLDRDEDEPHTVTRRPWWPPDTSASGPPKQD